MNAAVVNAKALKSPNKRQRMKQGIGIALLIVGIALLIFGSHAADSLSSDLSRAFNGVPTDKAIWLLLGGGASAIVGAVLTFRPSGRV